MAIDTISIEYKINQLKGDTGRPEIRYSDQYEAAIGTNRLSEKKALIGDTGEPWQLIEKNYIEGL